jgi:hypothetical protein
MRNLRNRLVPAAIALALGAVQVDAHAARATRLAVTVTDPSGTPIPTAVIRYDGDASWYGVNSITGVHKETAMYPGRTTLEFHPGLALSMTFTASGFAQMKVDHVLAKKGLNRLAVVLTPVDSSPGPLQSVLVADAELDGVVRAARDSLTGTSTSGHADAYRSVDEQLKRVSRLPPDVRLPALAELHELRALLAYRIWSTHNRLHPQASLEPTGELEASRQRSVAASHEWMQVLERMDRDQDRAQQLCLSAQRRDQEC